MGVSGKQEVSLSDGPIMILRHIEPTAMYPSLSLLSVMRRYFQDQQLVMKTVMRRYFQHQQLVMKTVPDLSKWIERADSGIVMHVERAV